MTAIQLVHDRTGAKYMHADCDDSNNSFNVCFRTTPTDSTGVAHVLEHTVLCGSEKYPVRDPFFNMLKRSLNTFMNAMTAPDFTMYPYSTRNATDYYNLLSVYLDAVFFPNITAEDFRQEGHRLELKDPEDPNSPLIFAGVVFNEMKGAMSSAESQFSRSLSSEVYPTSTYHHNSGGDPKNIPELSHKQLVRLRSNPNACTFRPRVCFRLLGGLVYRSRTASLTGAHAAHTAAKEAHLEILSERSSLSPGKGLHHQRSSSLCD